MAVLLQTSLGTMCIDLRVDEAPIACKNFLKLCKIKYYNNNLFYNVQQGLLAQTGDPTATGSGGSSVYGLCYGEQVPVSCPIYLCSHNIVLCACSIVHGTVFYFIKYVMMLLS